MARHTIPHIPDYFEHRAEVLEAEQQERYRVSPPADDDLSRHLDELDATTLIQNFRNISKTYDA